MVRRGHVEMPVTEVKDAEQLMLATAEMIENMTAVIKGYVQALDQLIEAAAASSSQEAKMLAVALATGRNQLVGTLQKLLKNQPK